IAGERRLLSGLHVRWREMDKYFRPTCLKRGYCIPCCRRIGEWTDGRARRRVSRSSGKKKAGPKAGETRSPTRLLSVELEHCHLRGARSVVELDDELAAGARPRLVGLPDVGVLARHGVVLQAALAGRERLKDRTRRGVAVAGDLLRGREARGEDVEPLV